MGLNLNGLNNLKRSNSMKDMKIFYWKLLLWQTIFYGLIGFISYYDAIVNENKLLWKPFVLTFYGISVLFTFIIPMIKQFKQK